MTVYGMLGEAVFRLDLRSDGVWGAIGELVDQLALSMGADDLGPVLTDLRAREGLSRAARDAEFALLHAVTPQVGELGLAFGRSPLGLRTEGADAPLVHFICLLLVPPHKRSVGFRLLNGLAVLLRDPMVRTQLLWAETVDDALAVCRQALGVRRSLLGSWVGERLAGALRPTGSTEGATGEGA